MSLQMLTISAPAAPPFAVVHDTPAATPTIALRTARTDDATAILSLIDAHLAEGHLLPRALEDVTRRASRFVVGVAGASVLACAELAPLSPTVAEVRSLVVHRDARHDGLGRALVDELVRRARAQGFDTLTAFTHGPGFFVRRGFSLVPHHWMREKIAADCHACAQFRRCGQSAVVLSLVTAARGDRSVHP